MTNKEIENFVEDFLNNHSEIFEYPKKYQDGGYEIAKGVFTGERGYQEYLKALKNIINYE